MSRQSQVLIAGLVALLTATSLSAQQDVLVPAGSWIQGPALCVAAHGGNTLVGTGAGLDCYALANPAAPQRLGRLRLPFAPRHVAWDGGPLGALASDQGQLAIVDLTSLAAPTLLALLDLAGPVTGMALADSLLYLGVQTERWVGELAVVDLREPQQPLLIHEQTLWEPGRLVLSPRGLVAGSGDQFVLYGLDDPAAPVQLSTIDLVLDPRLPFAVAGDLLVSSYVFWEEEHGFQAVDISDPAAPARLGLLQGCYFGGVLGLAPPWAYATCGDRVLSVLDFHNPAQPAHAGDLALSGMISAAALDGDLLSVVVGSGLDVVDLAQPEAPVLAGGLSFPGIGIASAASGRWACLAQSERVLLLDVSDPAAPTPVDSVFIGDSWNTQAKNVAFLDSATLAVCSDVATWIFQVAADGRLTDVAELPGSMDAVAGGGLVCLSRNTNGESLQVWDLADENQPRLRSTVALQNVKQVEMLGRLAIVRTNQPAQLLTVDLADPDNPVIRGQLDWPEWWSYSLAVRDSLAYVSVGPNAIVEHSLQWIDLRRPEQPQILGSLTLRGALRSLAVCGAHLVGGGPAARELSVFALGGAGVPEWVQTLAVEPGGWPGHVASANSLVFLPAEARGLTILRNTLAPDPAFSPELHVERLPDHRLRLSWSRHPAPGFFRVEQRGVSAGPWESLLTTRQTTVEVEPGWPQSTYRVVQVFE
ncbi:MAG: hypothetical protein WC326_11910 [Candidatus Delongbacteria bacterium]